MSLSDYAEHKLLAHVLGESYWEGPDATYIGLFSNVPSDTVPGAFITDAGLKHIQWNVISSIGSNVTTVTFGPANVDWGEVTAFGLYDSIASSNLLLWGVFDTATPVTIPDTFTIEPGDIEISLD